MSGLTEYAPPPTPPDHPPVDVEQLLERILEVLTFGYAYDQRTGRAPAKRTNGNVDAVAAKTDPVTLLPANVFRRGSSIYNDSVAATLYVRLGPGASANEWSVKLGPGDYYEPPTGYRGEITGVWTAVDGQARVTEFN